MVWLRLHRLKSASAIAGQQSVEMSSAVSVFGCCLGDGELVGGFQYGDTGFSIGQHSGGVGPRS